MLRLYTFRTLKSKGLRFMSGVVEELHQAIRGEAYCHGVIERMHIDGISAHHSLVENDVHGMGFIVNGGERCDRARVNAEIFH